MGDRSTPKIVEGAVQWSNKIDTSLLQVSNEWDDHCLGQGTCDDAALASKSCIMVNVTKILQKDIRVHKKQGKHTVEVQQKAKNEHTWNGEG
jgi:hypothetical protein